MRFATGWMKPAWLYLQQKLAQCYACDYRALALFRMGLGILILWDLARRAVDLQVFYSDAGILPRWELLTHFAAPWTSSLYLMNGTAGFQELLFLLNALFAVCFIVGYRTRLVTILCWLLMLSLQARNPIILYGADNLARVLLFWALFLPLNRVWAMDARASGENQAQFGEDGGASVLTPWIFAYWLQIMMIYGFAILHKTGVQWHAEGSAVYYALHLDRMLTPFGLWLKEQPNSLLSALTYATYLVECLIPVFLMAPLARTPLRLVAIFLTIALHQGFGLAMTLGLFPWWDTLAVIPFLPSAVLDRLQSPINRLSQRVKSGKILPDLPIAQQTVPSLPSWCSGTLASLLILYCFYWNVGTLNRGTHPVLSENMRGVGVILGIDQHWDMFAPYPYQYDGWYVIPAVLRNGEHVDLITGKAVSWEKPADVAALYPNERWLKYLEDAENRPPAQAETMLRLYAQYQCRRWNMQHQTDSAHQLMQFEIYFMQEQTRLYQADYLTQHRVWVHYCFPQTPPK